MKSRRGAYMEREHSSYNSITNGALSQQDLLVPKIPLSTAVYWTGTFISTVGAGRCAALSSVFVACKVSQQNGEDVVE